MPAAMACSGTIAGQAGVCMVRCMNPANAGPFGGCVPVQMASAAANASQAQALAAAAPVGQSSSGQSAAGQQDSVSSRYTSCGLHLLTSHHRVSLMLWNRMTRIDESFGNRSLV
jgi:hypothetical protein